MQYFCYFAVFHLFVFPPLAFLFFSFFFEHGAVLPLAPAFGFVRAGVRVAALHLTPRQHRLQGHTGCRYTPDQSNVLPLISPLPSHLVASPPCVHPLSSVAEVLDLEW